MLFRSLDSGDSWEPLPFPAQLNAVLHALVIDPKTPGVYMAGLSSESAQFSGILRSSDAGLTWQLTPDLVHRQVWAITFFPGDPGIVAAGTDTGIFLSHDGGIHWSRISPLDNFQLQPVVSLAFDPTDSGTIYAGTPHLPWKTTDSGSSWQPIHNGMLDDSDVFSIQVDRNRPQRLFASACSGMYRSLNGGASWERLVRAKQASFRTYIIIQDPESENVWFAGTTFGLMRSANSGTTWEMAGSYATRWVAFDPERPGRAFIATDAPGILRSEDSGKTWHPVNRGFSNWHLNSLVMTRGGIVYTTTVDQQVTFKLGSNTSDWEQGSPVAPAVTSSVALHATSLLTPPGSHNLVVASRGSTVSFSEDGGRTWKRADLPTTEPSIRGLVQLEPPWFAAVGLQHLFLSDDGRTWKVSQPLPGEGQLYDIVATSQRSLLAATYAGLRASDDLGASWLPVRGELDGSTIQALCKHPDYPSVLFAAKYGTIYKSSDQGVSWTVMSPEGWPVKSVKQLVVAPGNPDRLFVLTQQQGVFVLPLNNESR